MEIKIDTEKENIDNIKKIITFLQAFVNENSESAVYDDLPSASEGMFNMFNDNDSYENTSSTTETDSDDEDDSDPDIQIMPYD